MTGSSRSTLGKTVTSAITSIYTAEPESDAALQKVESEMEWLLKQKLKYGVSSWTVRLACKDLRMMSSGPVLPHALEAP